MPQHLVTPDHVGHCPACGASHTLDQSGAATTSRCARCDLPLMLIANKYRLVRQIGAGGCARIYEAEHIHLHEEAKRVIKIVKPEVLLDQSIQQRFYREIQVTSVLSQKNQHIVRIFDDFGHVEGLGHFYVMEFLEGRPLTRLIKDPNPLLRLELVYHLFIQLCDAMEAAHHKSIVHRDLKPSNLMLIEQGREPHFLKVIDFGISKLVETSEFTLNAAGPIGTPKYMAPEQVSMATVDERTDIYSMGILLYEMLAGRTPFVPRINKGPDRIHPIDMMKAHCVSPVPPLDSFCPPDRVLPAGLDLVIQRALAKEPTQRYESVAAFEQAFRDVVGDQGTAISSFNALPQQGETLVHHGRWDTEARRFVSNKPTTTHLSSPTPSQHELPTYIPPLKAPYLTPPPKTLLESPLPDLAPTEFNPVFPSAAHSQDDFKATLVDDDPAYLEEFELQLALAMERRTSEGKQTPTHLGHLEHEALHKKAWDDPQRLLYLALFLGAMGLYGIWAFYARSAPQTQPHRDSQRQESTLPALPDPEASGSP